MLFTLLAVHVEGEASNFKSPNERVAESMRRLAQEHQVKADLAALVGEQLRFRNGSLADFMEAPLLYAFSRGTLKYLRRNSEVTFALVKGLDVPCLSEDHKISNGEDSESYCTFRSNNRGVLTLANDTKRVRDSLNGNQSALKKLREENDDLTMLRGSFALSRDKEWGSDKSTETNKPGSDKSTETNKPGSDKSAEGKKPDSKESAKARWAGGIKYTETAGQGRLNFSKGVLTPSIGLKLEAEDRLMDSGTFIRVTQQTCPGTTFCQKTIVTGTSGGGGGVGKVQTSISTGGDRSQFELSTSTDSLARRDVKLVAGWTRGNSILGIRTGIHAEDGEELSGGTRSLEVNLKEIDGNRKQGVLSYNNQDSRNSKGLVAFEKKVGPTGRISTTGSYQEKPGKDKIQFDLAFVVDW